MVKTGANVSTGESERGKTARHPVRAGLRRRGLLPRPRPIRALTKLAENLPTRGNDLEIFVDGDRLFDNMIADIEAARTRINLEMYMFLADEVGWRFARALGAAARRGIEVRLIYDSVGCFGVPARLFASMAEAGVHLLEYHPIAPWRKRFALFGRNHRKTLIVDGRIGYTGGFNLGRHWLSGAQGGAGWRDTHARVDGPAAGDLEVLFTESWFRQSGELLECPRTIPRDSPAKDDEDARRQIYVVGSRGGLKSRTRRLYLLALGRARRSVSITSAYLVPDLKIRRALRKARQRGVEVNLLLPERSDVTLAHYASRSFFDRYLRQGIGVYLWQPSVLHAKTAVIDQRWSTIGSTNLDSLSLNQNLECNFVIDSVETGRALDAQFVIDLDSSRRLTLDEWRKRPLLGRLFERLAALLGPIL